jgi:hypothetical protein
MTIFNKKSNNATNNINYNYYSTDSDSESKSDSESTDNESITDTESDTESNMGPTFNKYNIVLCEIFNPIIHGIDYNSDPEIIGHYLVHSKFDIINWTEINGIKHEYKKHINRNIFKQKMNNHPLIRNYKNIITKANYIKPEIAEIFYLSGDECISILKTFWIRIFVSICKNKMSSLRLLRR